MKKNNHSGKSILIAAGLLLLIYVLFLINKDLFHFEYKYSKPVVFSPQNSAKSDYYLTDGFLLKKGTYLFSFSGKMIGKKSSVFMINPENKKLISVEFADGEKEYEEEITIDKNETVRLGVSYDPGFGTLKVDRIRIASEHVLTRESVFRHLIVSLAVVCAAVVLAAAILRKKDCKTFFFILLLTVIICFPYFSKDFFLGDDLFFHLSRIEGIAQTLQAGYFPARNQLFWLQNYGYGVGYFYPELFMYIPAVIRCIGFSILTSYKAFIIFTTFCSLFSFYFAGKKISNDKKAGYMTALIAAFAVYRLHDMYGRAAVGEIQAFVFGPFIILGLFEIFNGHPEKWYHFAFGFWGIFSSHLISLSIAFVVTAIYIILNIKKVFQSKEIFPALIKSVLIVLGLMTVFLFPMLEQLRVGNLVINILTSSKAGGIAEKHFIPITHLFWFFHTWRDSSLTSNNAYPGLFFILIPFLRLLQIKKRSAVLKCADWLMFFSIFLLFAATKFFPWEYFKWYLNRIQFPWRLLLPVSILMPLCGGIYIISLCEKRNNKWFYYSLFGLIAFITGFPVVYHTFSNRMISRERFWMQDNRVSGGEYKPIGLDIEYVDKNKNTVKTDHPEVEITAHKREGLTFSFEWNAPENVDVNFDVPLIDYVGYQADLIKEDGVILPIPVLRAENGLVQVGNHGLSHGSIHVHFEKTTVQKVSEYVTGACYMLILALCILKMKKQCAEKNSRKKIECL